MVRWRDARGEGGRELGSVMKLRVLMGEREGGRGRGGGLSLNSGSATCPK